MKLSTVIVLLGNSALGASAAYAPGFDIPSFQLQAEYMRGPSSPHALGYLKRRGISRFDNFLSPVKKVLTRSADDAEDEDEVDDDEDDNNTESSEIGSDIIAGGQCDINNLTAGQAWDLHRQVNSDYFTKHPITVWDSRPDLFFNEFMDSYATNDPFGCKQGRTKLSQVQCFLRAYTGDLNWNCRIDTPHVCTIASASQILDHVWSNWPTTAIFTVERKAEIARKAYFSLLNLRASQAHISSLFNIMNVIEESLQNSAQDLIDSFAPQPDKFLVKACEVQTLLTKLAIKEATKAIKGMVGQAQEDMLDENAEDHIDAVKKWKKYYKGIQQAMKLGQLGLEFWNNHKHIDVDAFELPEGVKKGIAFYNYAFESGLIAMTDEYWSMPEFWGNETPHRGASRLRLTMETPTDWCGIVWGVSTDNGRVNVRQLTNYVAQNQRKVRDSLAETFEYMISYHDNSPDNIVLRGVMATDQFTTSGEMFQQKSYLTEKEEVEGAVRSMLISEVSAASRCYMECNVVPDARAKCDRDTKRTWVKHSRYCPDDKTVCQISCLPKAAFHTGSHQKQPLWGMKHLGDYGYTMEDLLINSWDNWNVTRSIPRGEPKIYDGPAIMRPALQNLHLPVCYGPYDTVDSTSQLQFGCGKDWKLGDTKLFLERAGILQGKKGWDDHELRHMGIPPFLKQVDSPIRSFLLLCGANTRWPWSGKHALMDLGEMCHGKDPRCRLVQEELEFMKTEFQANHHFCLSQTAKAIFSDEAGRLTRPANGPKNLKKKCDDWVLHNKHLFSSKGKNTKKNFQKYMEQRKQEREEKEEEKMESREDFIEETAPGKNRW